MHPLSHTTVNKLCADMTGFYLQVRMSDSGKHKESNADRVKAGPIKYKDREQRHSQYHLNLQVHLQVQLHITTVHEAFYVYC